MIQRDLLSTIKDKLFKNKAIIITGSRQTGKTTLLQLLIDEVAEKALFLNCDEPDIRKKLTNVTSVQLKKLIGKNKLVCIDEVQRIEDVGITLKLITDQIKDIQLVVTGSSSLELSSKINEPLTGRKFEYFLFPFSQHELVNYNGELNENRLLENRILYGMYPDVINNPNSEQLILKNIVNSYLYKDIFSFRDVRRPEIIEKLVEVLALQIGSEVSYNELSQILGVDYHTVTRYLDLLEKSFIIFRLRAFSRNARTELKKSRKIYFVDTGVRNAVIANFNSLKLRNDVGALWENFLISERRKLLINNPKIVKSYFWRTKQQQEIDYLEETGGKLSAYEFKWKTKTNFKFPKTFTDNYKNCEYQLTNPENYFEFLTGINL